MFISNNGGSFNLRWLENLGKHQRVSKYENDCRIARMSGEGVVRNRGRSLSEVKENILLRS